MKKILMFFVATAWVFGFAGVTGATKFTLSEINNLNPGIAVNLIASVEDPVWTPKQEAKPNKWPKFKKKRKKRNHSPAPVPEPATMLLFDCGVIGLAAVGRKKFQQGNTK